MFPTLFPASLIALALTGGVQAAAVQPPSLQPMELKTQEAVRDIQAMTREILDAQRKIIREFKATADSDDIRIFFGKNMYGWTVSEKCLGGRQEEFDAAIAAYQKDFQGASLIDELRLYAKKFVLNGRDNTARYELRLTKARKELQDGKMLDKDGHSVDITELERKTQEGLLRLLPFELEYLKITRDIASAHGNTISKLMD